MPSCPEANGSASIDRGEVFRIRDLQTSRKGIDLESAGGRIEEADGIEHVDRNAEIACAGLDQRHGLLPDPGVPRNRKDHGAA